MDSELISIVRNAYTRNDFWSKEAKRLYPAISLFRCAIDWKKTIIRFLREFSYIEEHYAILLELTGETFVEFLGRLISALMFQNHISKSEREQLLISLDAGSILNIPKNNFAQALIFKACLEIGRLRPAPAKLPSIIEFAQEVRQVIVLLKYPIEKALPKVAYCDPFAFSPGEFIYLTNKYRSTADYHLAASHYFADLEYHTALEEIARNYFNMDEAYKVLSHKQDLSPNESIFVIKYQAFRDCIF